MKADLRYSLYVLASAASAAAGLLLTEIVLNFYPATTLQIAFLANIVGGIFLLLPYLRGGFPWRGWPAADWLRFAVSAATIYAAGFVVLFAAIARVGSSKVILLSRVETIFVVVLAVIFLGERWSARHWFATFLALAGATLISFDPGILQFSTLSWGDGLTLLVLPGGGRRHRHPEAPGDAPRPPVRHRPRSARGRRLPRAVPLFRRWQRSRQGLRSWWPGLCCWCSWWFAACFWACPGPTYNAAMRRIGASRCAVLFLSVSFLTVALQVLVDAIAPGLGLRVPANLETAVAGGIGHLGCGGPRAARPGGELREGLKLRAPALTIPRGSLRRGGR